VNANQMPGGAIYSNGIGAGEFKGGASRQPRDEVARHDLRPPAGGVPRCQVMAETIVIELCQHFELER
jgi:hypothetical protein